VTTFADLDIATAWRKRSAPSTTPPAHWCRLCTPPPPTCGDRDYKLPGPWSYGAGQSTVEVAEAVLASIEGASARLLFASGTAAFTSIFQALKPGDHVVAPKEMLLGARTWLLELLQPWGVAVDLVDTTDLHALAAAMRPAERAWSGSRRPANPSWQVTDIAAAAGPSPTRRRRAGRSTAPPPRRVDPPIEHGADIVIALRHQVPQRPQRRAGRRPSSPPATTRSGNASSACAGPTAPFSAASRAGSCCGGLPHPGAARAPGQPQRPQAIAGTLPRPSQCGAGALSRPRNDPGHAVAKRQMSGLRRMLSIRVQGGREAAAGGGGKAGSCSPAPTSLGGVESLVEHRRQASRGRLARCRPTCCGCPWESRRSAT